MGSFRVLNLSETGGGLRLKELEQVDEELRKGNEREALRFVKDLQGKKPLGLRCFGAARQVCEFIIIIIHGFLASFILLRKILFLLNFRIFFFYIN